MAHKDELVIFVDDAIPGDKVKALVHKKKKDFWEARSIEIISPSPDRIDPLCKHFQFCGGCKWQNIEYEKQLEYKQLLVEEALNRIGKVDNFNMLPIVGADPVYAYRNKMEFSFSQRRWLTPAELADKSLSMEFALGLHVPGTFEKVLNIDSCLLQSELANTILDRVKHWAKNSGLEAYHLRLHTGILRFLVIRHSSATGEMMINLVTAEDVSEQFSPFANELAGEFPQIVSIVNNINDRVAQVAFGDKEILIWGRSHIVDGIGDFRFEISANSFFQTNTNQAEKLYALVEDFAELTGNETILDLYSGTGTIAIYLSRHAKKVIGIELVEDAVINARKNAEYNNVQNCEFVKGDMKDIFPGFSTVPDILVIDPPRAGMHKDVVNEILRLKPARIVYVSCNPTTLARDIELLSTEFVLDKVQAVDMFPHTYHIESVALLRRGKN